MIVFIGRYAGCVRHFKRSLTFFVLLPFFYGARGQEAIERGLKQNVYEAKSDSDRIAQMGFLSEYYYANKNFREGDSLVERRIMLAEAGLNQRLVLQSYFGNVGYLLTTAATKDRLTHIRNFIKRGLDYAKAAGLTDYEALAYSGLAAINSQDGQPDEALKNANLAFTTALNTENDSVIVICAVQLGNIYQQRSDILMAFKTFTNAQNLAMNQGKETLLPPVYHALANLYKKLKKEETARGYINQSLAINKKVKNIPGQVNDNIFLAKLTNNYTAGKEYLQEAVILADSLHNVALKIEAQKILFSHMLLKEEPAAMQGYLEGNPELKNVFVNTGPDYINWMLAEIFLYAGRADSALNYFKQAENSFTTGYDLNTRKNFFSEYALCYKLLNNIPAAISYYRKLYEYSLAASDLSLLKSCSNELKNLYRKAGDFKQAFDYSLKYDHYKDSVNLLEGERDLALLEIDNVTKQQQREAELASLQLERKYNLQYMLITVVVVTVFVLMLMIGMFKVSTFTIRLLGFFSLIFLFEFIILLLDKWIHSITHGEPWKSWLIKIGIISALLPVHHFLEHKLIQYLMSHHLIRIRGKISGLRIFGRKKEPRPQKDDPDGTDMNDPDI